MSKLDAQAHYEFLITQKRPDMDRINKGENWYKQALVDSRLVDRHQYFWAKVRPIRIWVVPPKGGVSKQRTARYEYTFTLSKSLKKEFWSIGAVICDYDILPKHVNCPVASPDRLPKRGEMVEIEGVKIFVKMIFVRYEQKEGN